MSARSAAEIEAARAARANADDLALAMRSALRAHELRQREYRDFFGAGDDDEYAAIVGLYNARLARVRRCLFVVEEDRRAREEVSA